MSAKATTSTTAATPQTIPVKYQFEGSLRRTAIDVPPRMQQLREKLAKSFPKFAHLFEASDQILRLTYVDDEGDEITITSNEELEVAYRVAQAAGKVLRFTVPSFESNTATRITSEPSSGSEEATSGSEEATEQTPAERRRLRKQQKREKKAAARAAFLERKAARRAAREARFAEKAAAKTAAKTAANPAYEDIQNAVLEAAESAARELAQTGNPIANAALNLFGLPPVHHGVTCDRSGMSPIVGPRFHKRGENYDLCEAEFNKITDPAERAEYVRFDVPQWTIPMPAATAAHDESAEVVHRGISCDRSGVKPIRGIRYHKRGENYDLCQAEFDKITDEAEKAQYISLDRPTIIKDWKRIEFLDGVVRHRGIVCDVTGESPIVGPRYHKRGANYDICQRAFDALDESEKKQFIRLDRPTKIFDFPREHRRGGRRGFFGPPWRRRGSRGCGFRGPPGCGFRGPPGCGFGAGGPPMFGSGHPAFGNGHPAFGNGHPAFGNGHPAFGNGHPAFGNGHPAFGNGHPAFGPQAQFNWRRGWGGRHGRGGKTRLEFVKDVTVPDGETIAPGAHVVKTWELRASRGALPTGVTLVFVDGVDLQVQPVAVEPVEGDNFQVTIEFDAPVELGNYRSFYRFMTNNGKHFGPHIWVDFVVEDVANEGDKEKEVAEQADPEAEQADPEAEQADPEAEQADPEAEQAEQADQADPVAESEDTSASNSPVPIGEQPVLAQLLAGINVAPQSEKAALAGLLYQGLDSGDLSAVVAKLATLNIQLE